MKKLLYALQVFSLLFVAGACKKERNYTSDNAAAINVINGIISQDVQIKMNGSINKSGADRFSNNASTVYFGSNAVFYTEGKITGINFLKSDDQTSLLNGSFDFKRGSFYTLLLAGTVANPETVLIDDSDIPVINESITPSSSDSVVNLRFINLSPDTQPIDIRRVGSVTNDVTGLGFKSYSAFRSYPSGISSSNPFNSLDFEIVENGVILTTFSVVISSGNQFKNIAFVLTGLKSNSSLSVSEINYFQF